MHPLTLGARHAALHSASRVVAGRAVEAHGGACHQRAAGGQVAALVAGGVAGDAGALGGIQSVGLVRILLSKGSRGVARLAPRALLARREAGLAVDAGLVGARLAAGITHVVAVLNLALACEGACRAWGGNGGRSLHG